MSTLELDGFNYLQKIHLPEKCASSLHPESLFEGAPTIFGAAYPLEDY